MKINKNIKSTVLFLGLLFYRIAKSHLQLDQKWQGFSKLSACVIYK